MLKRHGIKFYTSEKEDLKATVVERFNRTFGAAVLSTEIFLIERYDIYTDGVVKNFEFGDVFESLGEI